MSKILRLINDEKKNLTISIAKGCGNNFDGCAEIDVGHCETGADYCGNYDYAACSGGSVDDCRNIDNSACLEKHFDLCTTNDCTFCAEAEKYDFEG